MPVTSVARTIVDLSRTLKGRPLEALIDRADQRGLVDFEALRSANSASLQAVLNRYSAAPTRSELEDRFLTLCDDHGIRTALRRTLASRASKSTSSGATGG